MDANIVYLKDEISRVEKRIEQGYMWLQAHPQMSYYIRKIRGKDYVYAGYREGEKVRSKYISNCISDISRLKEDAAESASDRKKAKNLIAKLKKQKVLLERQLKIALKGLELG